MNDTIERTLPAYQKADKLSADMKSELIRNILPFWMNQAVDEKNGGFFGRIDGNGNLVEGEDKGGILNARILWTFSSAFLHLKEPVYRLVADRARQAILSDFFDEEYGGTFWKIKCNGKPQDTKKQIYSQAFFIYAFSEHYRATKVKASLDNAVALFYLIEEKSFDAAKNGYFEAFSRDWKLLEDLRLSEKDINEKKTTNTHLHILEAYTNLYRVWKDNYLKKQLKNLIGIFLNKIIDPETHHMRLFFDEDWKSRSQLISYGHDIEASWLIYEAARVLGDQSLIGKVKAPCISLAMAALEGLQEDGSLIYEKDPETGRVDYERHWWPQAETIVGLFNLYEMTGKETCLEQSIKCWDFINKKLIDRIKGEWYWSVYPDGTPNLTGDKAGFWKCPYHNSRACFEVMDRVKQLCSQ